MLEVAKWVMHFVHLREHFQLLLVHANQFCVVDLERDDGLLSLQAQLVLLEFVIKVLSLLKNTFGANNSLCGLCPLRALLSVQLWFALFNDTQFALQHDVLFAILKFHAAACAPWLPGDYKLIYFEGVQGVRIFVG